MKRFRTITMLCLSAILMLVVGNAIYLCRLYDSLKKEAMQTVTECVRRADILDIISRMKGASLGSDDSFIRLNLMVQGEKGKDGNYEYPNLLNNVNQTMSLYFHFVENMDKSMSPQKPLELDSIFKSELNAAGLFPGNAMIRPYSNACFETDGLWSVDFSISNDQGPIYTAYFSPLNGQILSQMAGIISTSAGILILMSFLIWYLLHWVGKLRTIEEMKDDFTHNMTHELKTPVAVAYSAADSMLRYYDQSDEARNKKFLRIILQRLSFLSGMIENILSMSMERFKSLKLDMGEVALKPLAEDIAGMIELKAEKPVKIYIDIPDNLTVRTDSLHFGNVLSNLLDNAVKYSNDSVEISIKADENQITVKDNGIGIAKADLPYIFDKFYRVSSGDRYEVGGYGLGLFYARQIVTLMGWSISANSEPGKGTTFTIKFRPDEKG